MLENIDLKFFLNETIKKEASDLHLRSDDFPCIRIEGDIEKIGEKKLESNAVKDLIYSIMTASQIKILEENKNIDFAFSFEDKMRFRVNAFYHKNGVGAVFRKIPNKILSLDDLKFPKIFYEIINHKKGLILVTGATGSGKSTTLSALINEINIERKCHILTIEDPIEFMHESKKSLITQREIGENAISFDEALKSSLREDPDCILVGEMRDATTISLALTLAETGHLVLASLHTMGAPESITRIIDAFPASKQTQIQSLLGETLLCVISQELVKGGDGKRVPIFEIMISTPAIKNLIRENKIHQIKSIMQTSKNIGMVTFENSLSDLRSKGVVVK